MVIFNNFPTILNPPNPNLGPYPTLLVQQDCFSEKMIHTATKAECSPLPYKDRKIKIGSG
jgi:hypothetical protein